MVTERVRGRYVMQRVGVKDIRLLGPNIETLVATKVLGVNDARVQVLDTGGAVPQTVQLPSESASVGAIMFITNPNLVALGVLNIVGSDGVTAVKTIAVDSSGVFVCDGVTWHGISA